MTDYSKFDQLELAQRKLIHFNSFLSELIQSKKKKRDAVEQDKHQYYDNPPYVWSYFRKYLAENHPNIKNDSFLADQLLELVSLADECIEKYSRLFAIPEKKLRSIFIDYPLAGAKMNFDNYSFKIDIEFCVKGSDYIHRLLKSIGQDSTKTERNVSSPKAAADIEAKPVASTLNSSSSTPEPSLPPIKQEPETTLKGDKELADYLGISLTNVWRLKRDSKLPFHKVGRKYYYKRSEIDSHFKQSSDKRGRPKQ